MAFIRQDSSFLLQSSAIGISGWMRGEPIAAQPVAALPFAGGRSDQDTRNIYLNDFLSCKSASASTYIDYADEGPRLSTVVTLERVNVADVLTADRIIARLTGEPKGKGSLPISTVGTYFENLRIAGYPVEAPLELEDKFLGNEVSPVSGSLIRKFETRAIGITVSDHLISIPGFGTVALADYYHGNGNFDLVMLRVEVQNGRGSAKLAIGSVSVNMVVNRRVERPSRTFATGGAERNRVHEPTPEAWGLARSLTRKLMSADRAEAVRYTEDERQIYLTDVRSDVLKFRNAKYVLYGDSMRFPCLVAQGLPGPIPIFLGFENSLFAMIRRGSPNWLRHWTYEVSSNVLEFLAAERPLTLVPDTRIELLDVETTEKYFSEGLEHFLAVRFDARQSDISAEPGHFFTVYTKSRDLTIHISPAYAIDPYLSFGDQLSPEVSQYVQPGRWIFGAPELNVTDMIDIPPRKSTHIQK